MKNLACLFALLCLAGTALAQPAPGDGEKLLARFAEALRRKDADAVDRLVHPQAEVHILWLDSTPAKRFTIDGRHYVQQLRALWRFTRDDRHEFGPVQWQQGAEGKLTARLRHRETRLLQETASGQEDQLELELSAGVDGLRVTRISSATRTW